MEYDIVVVGAGPAGSSAAAEAAKRGASVLLLEEHREVGLPIQCGEGLTECEMKRAGFSPDAPWVVHRSPGSVLVMPAGGRLRSTEPVYSIDRAAFDRSLADEAERSGSELRTGQRVVSIGRAAGRWELKVRGKSDYSVLSRVIIGADGPVSIVGRTFDAYVERRSVVGVGYNVSHAEIDDLYHFFFSSRWPDGYAWIFPRGDSYNIGVATSSRSAISLLREFAAEHGVRLGGRFTSGVIPAGFRMRFYSRVHGDSAIMLAGDAAGLTHPMTYGGIYPAVMSGRLAGEMAGGALSSGRISELLKYESRLRRSDFFVRKAYEVNRAIYSFSDAEFDLLSDIAGDTPLSEIKQLRAALSLLYRRRFSLIGRMLRIRSAFFGGMC